MKRWKSILAVISGVILIAVILFFNKQKMTAKTSGGIKETYYVTVEKVTKQNLAAEFTLTGTVYANNDVNIMSETSGKVTAVFVKVGDYKTAGSVLFQVDDELRKAAFISAEAAYEKASKDYERFKMLFDQKSATDAQLDQAKTGAAMAEAQYIIAKRQLDDTKIKTPISGYITARNVDIGSMVQAAPQATLVANIVDISSLKIKLNVSETDAFSLKQSDRVKITTEVYPGVLFEGRIESISVKADEAHTYPVEIRIANKSSHPLKAGMFARAGFNSSDSQPSLLIPRAAIIGSVKEAQVYVVENNTAKLRKIVAGNDSGTMIKILDGLTEGETVVVSGQNNLVDNIKVEIINK